MSAFLRLRTQRDVDTSRAHPRARAAGGAARPAGRGDSLRAILGAIRCDGARACWHGSTIAVHADPGGIG